MSAAGYRFVFKAFLKRFFNETRFFQLPNFFKKRFFSCHLGKNTVFVFEAFLKRFKKRFASMLNLFFRLFDRSNTSRVGKMRHPRSGWRPARSRRSRSWPWWRSGWLGITISRGDEHCRTSPLLTVCCYMYSTSQHHLPTRFSYWICNRVPSQIM